MKTKCLLVDDEPLAIALLEKHIAQLDLFEVTATCSNAIKALEILNSRSIDLLFLDIKMPKLSGIDLLKTLKHPPKVIITTAYREYALDGYDLDIVDYLVKPITLDRFLKAVERYMRISNPPVVGAPAAEENKFITLKSANKFFRIELQDIWYMESLKDYVKVVTVKGEIITKYKISDLEKDLSGKGFLRVHRSFVVNLKHVRSFTATDIEINRYEIPIGTSYKEMVWKVIGDMGS